MKKIFVTAVMALFSCAVSLVNAQKFDHMADTPPMGWSSWNKFSCNISEDDIKGMIDAIDKSGLRDAGYVYVNIDDCWHGERDADGFIQADTVKFKHGIKALADYAHSKNMKLGIYSCAGWLTCAGRPGSFGHEYQDALQYARWGCDYLKYDWCNTDNINPKGAYKLMRDAIHAAGRPMIFSLCEWGFSKPWEWAHDIGHLWRTTIDIVNRFDGDQSVLSIIDQQAGLRKYSGKGHWNDPDMLEVGNGMSEDEDRAHFTMWCMMAAPLILGNDVRSMSKQTADILMNKEMIAIDQDTLGIQGLRYSIEDNVGLWFKPLANGDWAVAVLNRKEPARNYTLDWSKIKIDDELSGRSIDFKNERYSIYNLWTHKKDGTTRKPKNLVLPGHSVVAYRLIRIK